MSTELFGEGISPGKAAGPLLILKKSEIISSFDHEPEEENARFLRALRFADRELSESYEKLKPLDPAFAEVFMAHRMLLKDPLFLEAVQEGILQKRSAEYALKEAEERLSAALRSAEDESAAAYLNDLSDAVQRIRFYLSGGPERIPEGGKYILFTEEIALRPLVFEHEKIAGIAAKRCDRLSHAAVLARSYGIPVVSGISLPSETEDGIRVFLDGSSGAVLLSPEEEDAELFDEHAKSSPAEEEPLPAAPEGLLIYGNAGSVREAVRIKEKKFAGIGLFRSEFLYLGRREPPSEEMLFLEYRRLLTALNGFPVVIRTADLRADKQASYVASLELLRTQLRALYRASLFGKLRILFPMVRDSAHFKELLALSMEVREEVLERSEKPREEDVHVPLGAMIELESAAEDVQKIAEEADFLSIGTNDLMRELRKKDRNAGRESVRALLPKIAEAAKRAGIPAVICGELAQDRNSWEYYRRIGITAVSIQLK